MTAMMLGESHDVANPGKEGLDLVTLQNFLDEMKESPSWRMRANLEGDFYDSNQHSPEDVADLQAKGLPVVTINLIAPVINLVTGLSKRIRTDWRVKAAGSRGGLTDAQALALSQELNDAERNSHADLACELAHDKQVKIGLGWVEVARSANPFKYRHRCTEVDRREIWWDMRSTDYFLDDARWLMRKKWNDVDVIKAMLPPKMHRYVDAAMNSTTFWDVSTLTQQLPYLQDDLIARDWLAGDGEWRSSDRKRCCAYEVWYRKWHTGWVLQFPDGRRAVEYDRRNPIHNQLVINDMVEPVWAAYPKMRLSWWVGPFRLLDIASPYTHDDFPYVPFWGYREDSTRVPYGMIRAMVSPQQEVNARRSRMMWQLGAVRVVVEDDAVDDHEATAAEIGRPDAYIRLRSGRRERKNGKPIEIAEHQGLTSQQFQIYQDAAMRIQDTAGIYSAQLGKEGAAESGVAIDQLISQGTTGLGTMFSNNSRSRTKVGQILAHNVFEDLSKQSNVRITPDRKKFPRARAVVFNERKTVNGMIVVNNDIKALMWTVALDDEPSTPAFKQQKMREIVEFAKGLDPQLQTVFADIVIMASDLPWKEEAAKRVRALTGQAPVMDENTSPEEIQEYQEQQAQAQQQAQIEQKAIEAEIEERRAKSELTRAQTGKTRAESIKIVAEIGLEPMQADPEEIQSAELENPEAAASGMSGMSEEEIANAGEDAMSLEGEEGMPGDDRVSLGVGM